MNLMKIAAAAALTTGMTATSETTLRVVSDVADKSRPGWEDAYTSKEL